MYSVYGGQELSDLCYYKVLDQRKFAVVPVCTKRQVGVGMGQVGVGMSQVGMGMGKWEWG